VAAALPPGRCVMGLGHRGLRGEGQAAVFVGHPAYGTRQLRADLDRFVWVLGRFARVL